MGAEENLKHFCDKGIVPIVTYNDISEDYILEKDFESIGIPNNCKKAQFESLKKLLPIFKNIKNVAYITFVDERKTTEGLTNLQIFIESKLSRLAKEENSCEY